MRDGWFSISLKARGISETGTMRVSGFHAVRRCAGCKVRGEITCVGSLLEAVITVRTTQPLSPSGLIPDEFSMSMSGVSTDDEFSIEGVGPLGLIVELVGRSIEAVPHLAPLGQPAGITPSSSVPRTMASAIDASGEGSR